MAKFKIEDALSLRAGKTFQIDSVDASATPGFDGDKDELDSRFTKYDDELYELQERLFANGRSYGEDAPAVLIVLQGMDTSGKGGAIRHVLSTFDPQGTTTVGFGKPTEEELEHDFLWRIRKHDPQPGQIVAFDRSHYEDVLIQRVHEWVDEEEVDRRIEAIRDYELDLTAKGVKVIKIFLHLSKDAQKENLLERTEREDKFWKYDPADVEERAYWDEYMAAYQDAIQRTDENYAPWYVIPTDNKKYARMALKFLIVDLLRHLHLEWPAPDFDPEVERERIENAD